MRDNSHEKSQGSPMSNFLDNGHLGPLIYETPKMTTDEIQRHLLPAQGWIELGDWQSANDELEKVEPQQRVHPYVLELRWQVYALAGKWDVAVELAGKLMEAGIPDCAERAFKVACHALHGLESDIKDFFNLPVPRTVWNKSKALRDIEFVRFVEQALENERQELT